MRRCTVWFVSPGTVHGVTFAEGTNRTMDDAVAMKNYNGHSTRSSPDPDVEPDPRQFFYTGRQAKRGRFCYWDKVDAAWRLSRYNFYKPPFVYVERVCEEIEP